MGCRWLGLVFGLLWGLTAQVWATDEDMIRDLRLEAAPLLGRDLHQAGPDTFVDPAHGISSPITGEVALDQTVRSHIRWDLGYYYSINDLEADRGSFVVGAAIALDRYVTQGHSSSRSLLLDLFAGWAWAFTPSWHLEEGFILGAGRTLYHLHGSGWWDDGSDFDSTSNGFCYEYGARIGTYYTLGHVQLGADVRYLVTQSYEHFQGSHTNADPTNSVQTDDWHPKGRIQGLGGSVSAGWRF